MKKVKAKTAVKTKVTAKQTKAPAKQLANGVDVQKRDEVYITTLDQVWGKNFSKFKPSEPAEYAARVAKLTRFDLQQECIQVGLVPHDDKEVMIKRLVKECQRDADARVATTIRPKQIVINSQAAQDILNRAGGF